MATQPPAAPESSRRKTRSNSLFATAISRPVTTAMVFLSLVVFGLKSYQQLPIELMPDISYPTLTVRTEFEGAAPEDVEKLLTRPLEETMSIVGGMVEITSSSSPGVSEIVLEFDWGTDMSRAQQEVRDRIDLFEPPREVTEKPVILRYDPSLDPVFRVALTVDERDAPADPATKRAWLEERLTEIRETAERHVKSDLEAADGIAEAEVSGGREEEVQVLLDSARLKSVGLTPQQIVTALSQRNINLSGGSLREGRTEYLVRTLNEFQSVDEIRDTLITTPAGDQARLGDMAQVALGRKDRETIVRVDGQEAVQLDIFKEGGANTVEVCNNLKDLFGFYREPGAGEIIGERLAQMMPTPGGDEAKAAEERRKQLAQTLKSRLPDFTKLHLVSDQSRYITASIDEVRSTAIVGGAFALAVLFLFLRQFKPTIITGIAIPISIVATFTPMFAWDISLNIMSLGGLALGVGMLVDNSIVVLESITRCREEGDGVVEASRRGVSEVGSAVTASTLTTIAVFFPIVFVEGVAGQLFGDLALAVTFSLLASLLVALFLIPMFASRQGVGAVHYRSGVRAVRAFAVARRLLRRQKARRVAVEPGRAEAKPGPVSRASDWGGDLLWALLLAAYVYCYQFGSAAFGSLRTSLRPLISLGRSAKGGARGTESAAVALLAGLAFALLLPLLTALAVAHLVLLFAGELLVLTLYGVFLLIYAVLVVAVVLLKVVLWLPLKLFDWAFNGFRRVYAVVLRHSLRFSPLFLLAVAALAVHAGYVAQGLGAELIPPLNQGEFGIRMEAPPGTRLEETEKRARVIEKLAMDMPEIDMTAVEVGTEDEEAAGAERGENVAHFTLSLANPEKNAVHQQAIMEALRMQVRQATPDPVAFTLPALFTFKNAVEVQVRAESLDELRRMGLFVREAIEDIPGLRDVELSMKQGYPEVIVNLDRELLAARNLSPETVAQRLRTEVGGAISTRFSRPGEKIDIRVRTDKERLSGRRDLRSLSISEGNPPIPLEAVATISEQVGPSEILRIDQHRVAQVTANVEGRDLGAVSSDIETRLSGVDYLLGGQHRELQTSYQSLQVALFMAIFLVYVVMACQFESIWHPALVMFSVPLAFIGVVYLLHWTATPLSVVVFIGGIILAGIVVNDAIVLVDYINQLRARGMKKREAVILAGQVRLRPIIMTTVTTVLGLIPMALWAGEGGEIRRPMALTVMAGLTSATVLTLLIIPMVYDLLGGRDKA